MQVEEIKATLVTAAREILEKQPVLRGQVEVDVFDDQQLSQGWLASFTLKPGGGVVEFRPADNIVEKCSPDLLARLTLTGSDGEFRRAVVRGLRGDWQMAR